MRSLLASQRGGANEHEASRRVKAELLVQMDGVGSASSSSAAEKDGEPPRNVMVLAASNFPWDLDEALRRRLEKRIYIPLPSPADIRTLLQINLRDIALEEGVELDALAAEMDGYSGADVTNLCRDAAFNPMRRAIRGLKHEQIKALSREDTNLPVSQADLEQALANVNSSVRHADIERHLEWQREFGST